jgi:hypothetical protein
MSQFIARIFYSPGHCFDHPLFGKPERGIFLICHVGGDYKSWFVILLKTKLF